MYQIDNQTVVDAIEGNGRTFRCLLDFGGFTVSGADVGRLTAEHTMSDDSTLTIGRVISRRVEAALYTKKSIKKGSAFRLYLYLLDHSGTGEQATNRNLTQWTHRELSMFTHEQITLLGKTKDPDGKPLEGVYIPMGEYIVTKVLLSGSTTTITAYDRLAFADQAYKPSIDFPADAGAVTEDILAQLGITERNAVDSGYLLTSDHGELVTADAGELLCSAEYTFTISEAPERKTCRDMLGAIASVYGGNAVLDRNGAYTTAFISRSGEDFDMEKLDEPELAVEDIRMSGIRCITDTETLTAGDPDGAYVAEIACPYMEQERLADIWESLRWLRWRPGQIYERLADPRRDIGDLRYYRKGSKISIPIMGLVYHFDGGLSADITACGQTEQDELSGLEV